MVSDLVIEYKQTCSQNPAGPVNNLSAASTVKEIAGQSQFSQVTSDSCLQWDGKVVVIYLVLAKRCQVQPSGIIVCVCVHVRAATWFKLSVSMIQHRPQ